MKCIVCNVDPAETLRGRSKIYMALDDLAYFEPQDEATYVCRDCKAKEAL